MDLYLVPCHVFPLKGTADVEVIWVL